MQRGEREAGGVKMKEVFDLESVSVLFRLFVCLFYVP